MKFIKLFLRLALGGSFLSAVADRFGMWPADYSTWGNWQSFVEYTEVIAPMIPSSLIPAAAIVATVLEVIFGIGLIIGWKTEMFGRLSGWLLLIFAVSMTLTIGVKAPLDYSVFSASAAGFALSVLKDKYLELDVYLNKRKRGGYRY